MSKFLNGFDGVACLRSEFRTVDPVTEDQIVVADYCYYNYEGNAFVLFVRDGIIYEVNGSHCSCYGLEDQWAPEETSRESLLMRSENAFPSRECYELVQKWAKEGQ